MYAKDSQNTDDYIRILKKLDSREKRKDSQCQMFGGDKTYNGVVMQALGNRLLYQREFADCYPENYPENYPESWRNHPTKFYHYGENCGENSVIVEKTTQKTTQIILEEIRKKSDVTRRELAELCGIFPMESSGI